MTTRKVPPQLQHTLPLTAKEYFKSPIIAGFECGLVHQGGHDLLVTTRHTDHSDMLDHYRIICNHGMMTVRDGLVPGHDAIQRLSTAKRAGIEAIWDLSHYHYIENPVLYVQSVVEAALSVNGSEKLWLCPVNEPSLYPMVARMPRHVAIDMAITMARVARDHHPDVGVMTSDPITGIGNRQFEATDAVIEAVDVDVVGVNYYPHTARTSLVKVLSATWRRYRKPIMVSETSWHDGHPIHHGRHPGWNKGTWLRHVLEQIEIARLHGVTVVGVCWYPIVDSPPWHAPASTSRWSHGLIRKDLSVDPLLSAELRAAIQNAQ